jgi:hypothetical protein
MKGLAEKVLDFYQPTAHKRHRFLLKGRVFNVVTLVSTQCSAHNDPKDAPGTLTVMHVLGPVPTVSCHLLCPQYGVAIRTHPGDTVIFNAREVVHANSDLSGVKLDRNNYGKYMETVEGHRLSATFYVKL